MVSHPNVDSSHPSTTTTSSSTSMNPNPQFKSKARRRRSLQTFLHIPLCATSKSSLVCDDIGIDIDANPMKATMLVGSVLPQDTILEIVDLLSPADVLSFSLTSSYFRTLLLPALYDTIILKSSKHCRLTLTMLLAQPLLCEHIKKLAVRPNYYLAWPKSDDSLDEGWVVKRLISISSNLKNMHTFDWDGLELPNDQLWDKLRVNCPKLKGIFTNVGTRPLDPQTSLFSFSNLTSFSLIVRHGLGGSELFPPLEEIPPRFWNMLLDRCPDLQELAICSFSSSSRVFNFGRVTQGRWPKLHTLTLGSFGYQSDFTLGPPGLADDDDDGDEDDTHHHSDSKIPVLTLGQFLDLHSELKYIRFLWNFKRWMSPTLIPPSLFSTTTPSLPNLDTFIGIYQQLINIPHPEKVETLDLTCEPVYENRLTVVVPILKKLTGLTSLDIWMHMVDVASGRGWGDHQMGFFRTVLEACPGLVDFHFMCTTSFTVAPLTHLIANLYLLPRLKRFSLTKGHKYGDENMLSTALRIFNSCPKLVQVNVRWAREKCLNHLKQEGIYDVIEWEEEDGERKGGIIERRPKTLMVFERGIPLIGKPFSRRYRYTLPDGASSVEKRGHSLRRRSGWLGKSRRRVVSSGVPGGDDVDESLVVEHLVDIGTESELDANTELEMDGHHHHHEDEEDGDEENIVSTSVKGREVSRRIGFSTPTTN